MSTAAQSETADVAELITLSTEIQQSYTRLVQLQLAENEGLWPQNMPLLQDDLGLAGAFSAAEMKLLMDPGHIAEQQLKFWSEGARLWQSTMLDWMGGATEPVVTPNKGDHRFRDEAWQHPLFKFIKQVYLLTSRSLYTTVAGVEGLDPNHAAKVDFFTRQFIDALAPSNFLATNPEVAREATRSGGVSLLRGLRNLLRDLERGGGSLRITMSDVEAFELGKNVAVTPGSVVFENDLIQLLQYQPSTAKVKRRPLLIVPPWINKYYILDLREKNSLIKWAVDQGHTVFVISWVNPDASYAAKSFDSYLNEGTLAALDAIGEATGVSEVNAIGYCLGGTLLAASLAYLAANDDQRIKSATFFASLLDFACPGELGVFIDEQQLAALDARMERGFLDGAEMATTFNMLRANDLIWSFFINNYLLGKAPLAFDLLYWNSDSTRMPAAMHQFYLRNMYGHNRLREPGGITLNDTPIDLGKIDIPVYFLSTVDDHIAPWQSTYAGTQLVSSNNKRFVLGGSGHIAGVINPPNPERPKYGYWTSNTKDKLPGTAEQWFASAERHEGSWWPDWQRWVGALDRRQVKARQPGDKRLSVIEAAPGRYAKLRLS